MGFVARYVDKIRIKKTLAYISKDMKILDLGCGSGWLTKLLCSEGFDCVGVDTQLKDNPPFFQGTADKIPFPDKHFDCLIMMEVIEHISPSCYKEIDRVLKDKGKIILSSRPGAGHPERCARAVPDTSQRRHGVDSAACEASLYHRHDPPGGSARHAQGAQQRRHDLVRT